MSELLKIVYDVAAVRSDYLRLHESLVGFSPRKLLRSLKRGDTARNRELGLTRLGDLTDRLTQIRDELSQLGGDDLSVRRGPEIQTALDDYSQALARSMRTLVALIELQRQPQSGDLPPGGERIESLKVAYDGAMLQQSRLGARLNDLLSTL